MPELSTIGEAVIYLRQQPNGSSLNVLARLAREHAGLEQTELAEKLGISRPAIGRIERGTLRFSLERARAWAEACGVDPAWLEAEVMAAETMDRA